MPAWLGKVLVDRLLALVVGWVTEWVAVQKAKKKAKKQVKNISAKYKDDPQARAQAMKDFLSD